MKKFIYIIIAIGIFQIKIYAADAGTFSKGDFITFINEAGDLVRLQDENSEHQIILTDVASVSYGYAVKNDNTLWTIGEHSFLTLNGTKNEVMRDVVKAIQGYSHVLILKTDNSLWGSGFNDSGQLALPETIESIKEPIKIMNNVQSMAVGKRHSIVLKTDGSVWTFGEGFYGQLGAGESVECSYEPIKIMDNAQEVFAGVSSSYILTDDNNLYRCGTNYGDITGYGDVRYYRPEYYSEAVDDMSSQWGFNLIKKIDGELWAVGEDESVEEKINIGNGKYISTPSLVTDNVNSIGRYSGADIPEALILKNNGELYKFELIKSEETDNNEQFRLIKITDEVQLSHRNIKIETNIFTDIGDLSAEEKTAVEHLSKAGIIKGTEDAVFSPDAPVTRAEIGAMLLRMTGKAQESANAEFVDVSPYDWFYNTAGVCCKYGIFKGYEDGTFRGNDIISKAEIISLAARTMKNEAVRVKAGQKFSEKNSISYPEWAEEDIATAYVNGLIKEDELTEFESAVTRAEAAVILYRLYDKI